MKTIYLAHSGREEKRGKKIEAKLEKGGIIVCNPFDKENEQKAKARWIDGKVQWTGDLDDDLATWIVDRDEEMIRKSDAVVMLYPLEPTPTIGTPCEMTYAHIIHVPVYAYVGQWMWAHPFVDKYATQKFDTEKKLLDFVIDKYGMDNGTEELLVEILASDEHEQWRHWANQLAAQEIISKDRLDRWAKFDVPFDELPEQFKESDRFWARKTIKILLELGIKI
jgi:nucleoside 2-deoxyribosyltransferase